MDDASALDAARRPLALRALAAGVVLAAALVAAPVTPPPPVAAIGPLPPCRLADIPTVPAGYDAWSTTLVDWLLTVGKDYKPPDLVSVKEAGIAGNGLIRKVAIDDLAAMTRAAADAGTPIAVDSAYRSYQEQASSFDGWVALDGYEDAITYSQRPGHSEHQLGLTIDFMTAGGGSSMVGDWGTTPTGRWMGANAWQYGWVLSYPKGTGGALFSDATCFHYEPWQFRYLGPELAARVHASGLTIREYLWSHFTMVDPTTGLPIPSSTPTPTASPTPTPAPTASPTPTLTAIATTTLAATPSAEPQRASSPFAGAVVPVLLGGLLLIVLASTGFAAWRRGLRR